MNPEEIKVGETYNVRVKVDARSVSGNFICASVTPSGRALGFYVFLPYEAGAFSPINAKNTDPAPKYDPCRKFRKGDVVKPCQANGRWWSYVWEGLRDTRFTVIKDEDDDDLMWVQEDDSSTPIWVLAAFFQLVSPVEEREPYYVKEFNSTCEVWNKKDNHAVVAMFFKSQYHLNQARELAEAERDRLNAEYRAAHNAELTAQNAEYRKERSDG